MSDKLQQAIDAIGSGHKSTAHKLLTEVLKSEPQNEAAWLWMSKVVTTVEQRKKCLQQALKLNPRNKKAQHELSRLLQAERQEAIDLQPLTKLQDQHQINNQSQLLQEQIEILSTITRRAVKIEDLLAEVVKKQDELNTQLKSDRNVGCGIGVIIALLILGIITVNQNLTDIISLLRQTQ